MARMGTPPASARGTALVALALLCALTPPPAVALSAVRNAKRRCGHAVPTAPTVLSPSYHLSATQQRSPRALSNSKLFGGVTGADNDPRPRDAAAGSSAPSNPIRHVRAFRPSFRRAVSILSLLLCLGARMAPASALLGKSNAAAAAPTCMKTTTSAAAKLLKVGVTLAAVAAGAATASKIRMPAAATGEENAEEPSAGNGTPESNADPRVFSKGEPSALPLASNLIDQQLKRAGGEETPPQPNTNKKAAVVQATVKQEPSELMKDLDSKIEMLRAREELARANAEKKRLQEYEAAGELRKKERVEVDARIAAAEKVQREQQRWIERKKRENELERKRMKEQMTKATWQEPSADGGGIPRRVLDVERARQQPKSLEEEQQLKEKYGSMDLEERAFTILVDLGMVEQHPDPDALMLWSEEEMYESPDAFM